MGWRWFDRTRLWEMAVKGTVARGCMVVSVSTVLGGGMAHTMFGWKGAVVVMVAATVVGGVGVGPSVGLERVSGGGKGRKQGMDE